MGHFSVSRRHLLGGAAAVGGIMVGGLPAYARSPKSDAATVKTLNTLFDDFFKVSLAETPEGMTYLGMDKGPGAAAKSKLDDRSPAATARNKDIYATYLTKLKAIDRSKLAGMDRVNYDTVLWSAEVGLDAMNRFPFGSAGYPAPYVLSQLTGAYQSVPDFLDSMHSIADKADADAYLSRVKAFATVLDQETDRFKADVAAGVVPPDFVIDKALTQLKALRDQKGDGRVLVASIVRRTQEAKVEGDWAKAATSLFEGDVRAALERQIAALEAVRPKATHDAGVWKLKDGEAYYAFSTKLQTTTGYSGEEIHKIGLEQCAEITDRIDGILKKQGMTQGTVGARIAAMGKDKRFLYDNTPEGKAKLLADLNKQMEALDKRLPEVFGTLPKSKVEVKRVPEAIEAGAPGGYYQGPALDGSRPGAYYINLRDTAEWPSWTLPTLTYHEAAPGHHFQVALQTEAQGLPMLRRIQGFGAYQEGWALYAEQLADEIGMYAGDPFGQVGYLQSFLFRAARLVVDTGLHHKRWSREHAIRWMTDTTGDQESSITTEVERYSVWPGQACSYKIGHTHIVRLREQAKAKLGSKFDIRGFHDQVLLSGAMPLDVLTTVIEDWTKSRA